MGRPQTEQQKDSSSSDDEQPEHVGAVEFSTPTPTYDPQQQQQFQQGTFPPAQPAQFPPQSPLPQYQTQQQQQQQQQQPQAYPPQQPNYAPPPPPQGPVQFPPTSNPQQATYMQMPRTPQNPAGQFNTTTGIPMQQQQFVQQPQQQFVQQMQPQQMYGAPASAYIMKPSGTVAWSTGLFDCMDDPQNAFMTAVCPCLTFGQIAEIIDNGHTTCGTSGLLYACGACVLSCTYRTKLRTQYDLVEAPAPDWATHFLCEPCALCQTYRELRFRGLDPAIGWQGNQMKRQMQMQMQQQQPQVMMAPMNQNMMQ